MIRRHELTVAHPGVYVVHSGPLGRAQREWVAVLAAWPAALADTAALPWETGAPITVAVEHGRKVKAPPGVRIQQVRHLADRLQPGVEPPRLQIEQAVVDAMARLVAAGDEPEAYALLARACFGRGRRATPDGIAAALRTRARVAGRRVIEGMVEDLRTGASSVLERGYLHLVERAHGLPRGRRQAASAATGRRTEQDVRYDAYGLIVEADGRTTHDTAAAYDADALRDLAEKAHRDMETVRVTYGMVFRTPCRTARQIAIILRRRGWTGGTRRCPRCPPEE
ncbi:hypothetical protein FHP29_00755 [Nocardioides albidus]|uniref:DUF559 domain-containing protein n=2 Tax=Nocardioides albidus TaxID=1517589 RepID=A0A5C4WPQ4_9ACTN|nr:hypothetical protein FHP29_00755 [Nocardioides albidus]